MRILSENLRDPTHVAFSPDGNLVFTNTGKTSGTIWEINSSNSRELDRSAGQVTQAVFSPDGQFLVTVSENRQAQLWDSYSGHFIRDLPGHTSSYSHDITAVSEVQFSPDGNYIATACGFGASCYLARGQDLDGSGIAAFDGTVRLWKKTTNTFELFYELPGERTDRVYGLAFKEGLHNEL